MGSSKIRGIVLDASVFEAHLVVDAVAIVALGQRVDVG